MANWQNINEKGNVSDRRGMGMTPKQGVSLMGIGVVLAVAYFGGGEQALQVLDQMQSQSSSQVTEEQAVEFAGNDSYEDFAARVLGSANNTWEQVFENYAPPQLVLFRGSTSSACGGAESRFGPHYCPADQTIYLDETFFEELTSRFGARGGDVAEAYVIAHEVGHHIQYLTGKLAATQEAQSRKPSAANQLSVNQELQADCYAGIWAYSLRGENVFEEGEIIEAIEAAEAVGDDNIQARTQGHIDEDSWTHGSSEDRKNSFLKGYNSGDVTTCQT